MEEESSSTGKKSDSNEADEDEAIVSYDVSLGFPCLHACISLPTLEW